VITRLIDAARHELVTPPQDDSVYCADGTVSVMLSSKDHHAMTKSAQLENGLGMRVGGFLGLMLNASHRGSGAGLSEDEVRFSNASPWAWAARSLHTITVSSRAVHKKLQCHYNCSTTAHITACCLPQIVAQAAIFLFGVRCLSEHAYACMHACTRVLVGDAAAITMHLFLCYALPISSSFAHARIIKKTHSLAMSFAHVCRAMNPIL
jgi:hypothetical protein